MIKKILKIFLGEWSHIFSTPRLLVVLFGIPIFIFAFYGSLMEKGVPTKLPVAILDQDKTPFSRQLGMMLNATSTIDLKNVNNELEGESSVRRNDSFAFIIIPKNFQRNIEKGNYTSLYCSYNGQYLLSGAIIFKSFQTVAQTFMAGIVLQTLEQKGLSSAEAMSSILPINADIHILYNPYTSYSYYLSIAFIPMALQIMAMIMSIYTFGLVLKQNRGLELLNQAGGNIYIAIIGKILPYTIIFFSFGFLMNCLLFYKIGTPFRGSFIGVNILFFVLILICHSIALFIVSITTSFRTALTIGGDYTALAFSFAGYTFPALGMNQFIQYLCYIFPYTSYMRFMVDYGVRGVIFSNAQKIYLIIFAVFSLFGVIGIPLYHKKLKKGHYDV
ncbi:ABC transporter permease [Chishuiella sp.]|uniref:ABC transporter permease n=1 Tax=Chishuiella sp. TaxID=1969467 RepID=UPI0028AD9037|nr:ABC transporter permease [Chishuiella sp.]